MRLAECKTATAGANSVAVTFVTAAVAPDIRIMEYQGLDTASPLEVAVGATETSATSGSGPLITTHAMDLLVGANAVRTATTGAEE
jgi:hypothetical protein